MIFTDGITKGLLRLGAYVYSQRNGTPESLNEQLQRAVLKSDLAACRSLIEARADANAQNKQGCTPLQTALQGDPRLLVAKVLIDKGAIVHSDEKAKICESLIELGVPRGFTWPCMIRRPDPYVPEVFSDGRFVSLLSLENPAAHNRPIALFNFADEPLLPGFGFITAYFSYDTYFAKLAEYFTVVRVLVDDPDRFVPIIDQVKGCLPGLPITSWSCAGHSVADIMFMHAVRPMKAPFSIRNTSIMRQIAERVDRFCVICLWGCKCAKGHDSLAGVFSKHSQGRIVCGSHQDVGKVVFLVSFPGGSREHPILIPFFGIPNPKGQKDIAELPTEVTVYQNGTEIVRTVCEDKEGEQKIVESMNLVG